MLSILQQAINDVKYSFIRLTKSYVAVPQRAEPVTVRTRLRESLYGGLRAPLKVEMYFWLYILYSFYTVTKAIVLIPFEMVVGIVNGILSIFNVYRSGYVILHSMLILTLIYTFEQPVQLFDVSYMYHAFRGQSTIKLYGLMFAFEVSQKLFTMLGQYLDTNIRQQMSKVNTTFLQLIPEICVCFVCFFLHTFSIYLQFNVYTVVINSSMPNFIIFCFVINLTKMKSTAFKKFDAKSYKTQINHDAKDRMQKILYITMFQLSQIERSIPNILIKLFFLFIIGSLIEQIKHTTVLFLCDRISEMDKLKKELFLELYINRSSQSILKCIQNDFTVIPFAVFTLKMISIIIYANFKLTSQSIMCAYLLLCAITISVKVLIILVRNTIEKEEIRKMQADVIALNHRE